MKISFGLASTALLLASASLYAAQKPAGTLHSATASTAATSAAPAMPKSPVPEFKQADTNHDGSISWAEAKAVGVPEALFKRDDFDHNGKLNETEWMFVRLDMTDFNAPSPGKGG